MTLYSKFQQSRQFDTEDHYGTPTELDFTQAYTLWATSTWPDVYKAVVPVGGRPFTNTQVFYTDSAHIDTTQTLARAELTTPSSVGFTFSANPVASGTAVTFTSTSVADPGFSIKNYSWDLLGAGTYLTNGGTTSTYTNTYTVATPATATSVITTAGNGSTNAVNTITLANAIGGTWTVTFNSQTTTALAYGISAANLQAALVALSTIGAGNITVTGTNPYICTFVSGKGDAAQSNFTTTVTNLVEQNVIVGLKVTDNQGSGHVGYVTNTLAVIHG